MNAATEQRNRQQVHVLADRLYRERYQYLLRIANRNAANREDAAEAVQFAFAAFIEKYDLDSGSPPLGWLTLTLQRRCWALRRVWHLDRRAGQEAAPGSEGPGFSLADVPTQTAGPDETVERAEYVLEARERLAALKSAERTALLLFGVGFSYREISDMTAWTFTKVNRCIAEGRAALRAAD